MIAAYSKKGAKGNDFQLQLSLSPRCDDGKIDAAQYAIESRSRLQSANSIEFPFAHLFIFPFDCDSELFQCKQISCYC